MIEVPEPVVGQRRLCPTANRRTRVVAIRTVGGDLYWGCEELGCATIVYANGTVLHADPQWHSYMGECLIAEMKEKTPPRTNGSV